MATVGIAGIRLARLGLAQTLATGVPWGVGAILACIGGCPGALRRLLRLFLLTRTEAHICFCSALFAVNYELQKFQSLNTYTLRFSTETMMNNDRETYRKERKKSTLGVLSLHVVYNKSSHLYLKKKNIHHLSPASQQSRAQNYKELQLQRRVLGLGSLSS